MDQHPPDPIAALAADFDAYRYATHKLFLAVDFQASMSPDWRMSTETMQALDEAREKAAVLGFYLPEDGITSAQTERAWQHAVAQAEAMTGLTQDQEPMTIEQQYENGLLSEAEYKQLVEDAREIEEDTCAMQGCINPFKPGYIVCEEHYQAMQSEAAEIEHQAPAPPRVQWLPGGAMIFADPQNKMPF